MTTATEPTAHTDEPVIIDRVIKHPVGCGRVRINLILSRGDAWREISLRRNDVLLSYRKFQAEILRYGWLFRWESAEAPGIKGRQAWLRFVEGLLADEPGEDA